jgi:hypothetical protein
MQIPTLITLRKLSSKFWNIGNEIATKFGMLLRFNKKIAKVVE